MASDTCPAHHFGLASQLGFVLTLGLSLWIPFGVGFAQFSGANGTGQRGADLGQLVETLGGLETSAYSQGVSCPHIFDDRASWGGFECLVSAIGGRFAVDRQWDLLAQVFAARFADRRSWPELADRLNATEALNPGGQDISGEAFAALRTTQMCPNLSDLNPLLPEDTRATWHATAGGYRDLSPPLVPPQQAGRAYLRQGLTHEDPAAVLLQTPCQDVKLSLGRALFWSALSFGDLERARAVSDLPFMPRRYSRQLVGALNNDQDMRAVRQEAEAFIRGRQSDLAAQGADEVAVLLNEVARQFSIDFTLGQVWSADLETLRQFPDDEAFVETIAVLLSQDARLLQQGYDAAEVRLFYPDFFSVLVQKEAFDVLQALDLLVPSAMATELSLALAARPLTAASPTQFEQDQEILALLIRSQELSAVEGIWADLAISQRREAVLFALDQGAGGAAKDLYTLMDPEDMDTDFLIRLALYYAALVLDEGTAELAEEIEISLEIGA